MITKCQAFFFCVVLGCSCLLVGVLIGYLTRPAIPTVTEDLSVIEKLMEEISTENIKENLRVLTKRPHIAGREVDETTLVELIKNRWKESGLDSITVESYEVLLSYPNLNDSNYIAVLNETGDESDVSQRKELVIDEEQNDPDVIDPFNAYSAAGEPKGELVYVNYGRIEDFMLLNRTLNIDTTGKICIARYGKVFRGDKATHAQIYGCLGLILYSDPADCSVPWAGVYPDDWYLPPTGAQRGTLFLEGGDPLTPNYPATSTAWRKNEDTLDLPNIPVTPIGYGDAVKYLAKLGGSEVKKTWKGRLNITYRYGPGFNEAYNTSRIKMHVLTHNERAVTRNVIGYIKGAIEPDRYIMVGNHRDAWVFGAIDPSSGTAVMLEIVRAFGRVVKNGWRPRRTIVFCSWGAEEYGLIGSTEWTENFQKILQSRVIVYLNVDISVRGNYTLRVKGVPSLKPLVYDTTKRVRNPDSKEIAEAPYVYDAWQKKTAKKDKLPYYQDLGSGSDYAPFQHTLGITSLDLTYRSDDSLGLSSYPVYHSVYETFELVSKFVDPDFVFHRAIGQIWAEIGRKFADSVLLPIDCRAYAKDVAEKRDALYDKFGKDMSTHQIDLEELNSAIFTFTQAATEFHDRLDLIDLKNELEIRQVNDQMMQLEKAFLSSFSLLGRKTYRHVINAPNKFDGYGTTGFPGLSDSLFDIDSGPDQEERWNEVKRQYSILIFHIKAAADSLMPVIPSNK